MDEDVPVQAQAPADTRPWESPTRPRPAYESVTWALTYTGVGRRTIQRRVDAWLRGDRTSYAMRSSTRPNQRGDRLVDPVDAERVRLQELGHLDSAVTAAQWDAMIAERRVPHLVVTGEQWFQDLVK